VGDSAPSRKETLRAARLLLAQGEPSAALSLLESCFDAHGEEAAALLLAAEARRELRQEPQALELARRAAVASPRSAGSWNGIARSLHALARDAEALDAAERARALLDVAPEEAHREGPAVYLTLVWCHRARREFREALARAEEGLARWPDAVLAQWASLVEEELAEAERERC
jgi:tetratricopeptide (TPR) repeat protein